MIVKRKCPFCDEFSFNIEKWSKNLYLLKCANVNVSASYWVEYRPNGRFRRVSVNKHPQPRTIPGMKSYDKQQYDKLQIPFWKLMGQKPKEKDIIYEKQLKSRGMTYGDAVLERSLQGEQHQSGLSKFNEHYSKYGRNNEPE